MKKNGFTLVEMIAAVVLIALLGTVILVNMTGLKNNEEQNSTNKFKLSIEEAACTYIDMSVNSDYRAYCKSNSSGCNISLKVLLGGEPQDFPGRTYTQAEKEARKFALIDPNYKDPETNKTAKEEEEQIHVLVHWVDAENATLKKECEFVRG